MVRKEKAAASAWLAAAGWDYQRTGGMTIFLPRTTVSLVMLLACLIAAAGTLYFALMPESVSPATTVWMMAAPLDGLPGAAGTGAAC